MAQEEGLKNPPRQTPETYTEFLDFKNLREAPQLHSATLRLTGTHL